MSDPQWLKSREVVERIVITGQLVLDTPAHFGNGDSDGLTDIALARDALVPTRPLLTGASIAGALRNYLREYQLGFSNPEAYDGSSLAEQLFGYVHRSDEASLQSWLMIDDALGETNSIELREGVAIDAATRTAEDKKKYDIELLGRNTTFPLRFELWLPQGISGTKRDELLAALVVALQGLSNGEIGLGTRKRRGLGQCHVESWRTLRYDMTTINGLLAWLVQDAQSAQDGLPNVATPSPDRRIEWHLTAKMALTDSLLIRANDGNANSPDMKFLSSRHRKGNDYERVPVLSGTSLAGALRGRVLRIANTVLGSTHGREFAATLFGRKFDQDSDKLPPDDERRQPTGSRVLVSEHEILGGVTDRVQNRVRIDHFTGGAFPGGLFSQQPVWSIESSRANVTINVRLRRPGAPMPLEGQWSANLLAQIRNAALNWLSAGQLSIKPNSQALDQPANELLVEIAHELLFQAQMGVLLLALKDLWTGDLPLGGESGIGRGRLAGQEATITFGAQVWKISADSDRLVINGPSKQLEAWVQVFHAITNETLARDFIDQRLNVMVGGVQ